MNARRNTERLQYHVFTLALYTSSAKLQHLMVKWYRILPLWVEGLEFRKSFTHLSWSCYAAPCFALNSNLHVTNIVLISSNCTKKKIKESSPAPVFRWKSRMDLSAVDDCWSWLTLLVFFCGRLSLNVFCLFDLISTKSNIVQTALCVGITSKPSFLTKLLCVIYVFAGNHNHQYYWMIL